VVMAHHAPYSASVNHGSTLRVQKEWVPIFERYRVDVVLTGHDHDYERTHPILANQKVAAGQGVVYVVAGGFYSPGYEAGKDWWTAVSVDGDVGNYVVLDITHDRLDFKAYSGDGGRVLDAHTLTK